MVIVTNDIDGSFLWPGSLSENNVAQNPPGDLQCSFGMKEKCIFFKILFFKFIFGCAGLRDLCCCTSFSLALIRGGYSLQPMGFSLR